MKNYGLKFDKIDRDHYFLGGGFIGTTIINPTGQWDKWLPANENQFNQYIDSMNCTSYGTLNCIEILANYHFGTVANYSERYTGILAGTSTSGNSPHTVAETIRSYGVIDDAELPFNAQITSWDAYYSPKPMISRLVQLGLSWLKMYTFKHEWVFDNFEKTVEEKVAKIKAGLLRSPIGMSVSAWNMGENGVYNQVFGDNHWVCCYGWDDTKQAWKIFDSYDNTHKLYSMKSNVAMAKLYWISIAIPQEYNSLWSFIFGAIKKFLTADTTMSDMKITAFAKAIQDHEGWFEGSRSWRNNNPGNLRWCDQTLAVGKDDKNFAIFKTYNDGFTTLKNMIRSAASGKSQVYKPDMTIAQFFAVYAPAEDNNDPDLYASIVAKAIGANISMPIKNLILN